MKLGRVEDRRDKRDGGNLSSHPLMSSNCQGRAVITVQHFCRKADNPYLVADVQWLLREQNCDDLSHSILKRKQKEEKSF